MGGHSDARLSSKANQSRLAADSMEALGAELSRQMGALKIQRWWRTAIVTADWRALVAEIRGLSDGTRTLSDGSRTAAAVKLQRFA
eukprot:4732185-Prymnesium_polylepis.1